MSNAFVKNLLVNVEEQGDSRAVQALADIARYLRIEGDYERSESICDAMKDAALTAVANNVPDGAEIAGNVMSAIAYVVSPVVVRSDGI